MKSLLILMFGLLSIQASAQDATDADAPAVDALKAELSKKEEPKKSRRKQKVEPFKKSKLSADRTEGEADRRSLLLALGVDKIVDLDFEVASPAEKAIQTGNSNLVLMIPVKVGDKNQLVIRPVAVGDTNITIRDKDGIPALIMDVTVTPVDLEKMVADLKNDLLKEVEGLEYKIIGGKLHIDGEILTTLDYGRLADVLSEKRFADNVVNHTLMSPISLKELAKRIQTDVQTLAPTVTTRVLNGHILLEGTVDDVSKIDAISKKAALYVPEARPADPTTKDPNGSKIEKPLDLVQNLIAFVPQPKKRDRKLVRLTVHFVELNKDYRKVFGFKWQPGFTADPSISLGTSVTGGVSSGGAGGQQGFSFAGTLSALFPTLQSMQDAGYGRIIRSATAVAQLFNSDDDPSVITAEGKIKIKDQQEFPSQAIAQNGSVAAGRPTAVGFTMEIVPTLLSEGNINLSLSLDHVSKIGENAGQPITATQNVTTRVYLKSGEVAAVASSDNSDQTTSYNRDDPNAGRFVASGAGPTTSPLFTINRSKNFNKKKTQFVVFVSPQIIENASDGTTDLKKNFRIKSN